MKTKFCAALIVSLLASGCASEYYRFSNSGEEEFVVAHAKCKAVQKREMSSATQQVVGALFTGPLGTLAAGDAAYEACMIELGWAPCKDAPISKNVCK